MMSAKLIDSKDPFKLIVVDVRFSFKFYFKVNSKEFISICQDTFSFFKQFFFLLQILRQKFSHKANKAQKNNKEFFPPADEGVLKKFLYLLNWQLISDIISPVI